MTSSNIYKWTPIYNIKIYFIKYKKNYIFPYAFPAESYPIAT